jgi:hypothetical protein
MELVDGVPFTRHARRHSAAAAVLSSTPWEDEVRTRTVVGSDRLDALEMTPRRLEGTVDEARLRSALAQVAEAVCAIHDAGILHRDIKPSNVLVTHDGRAVLLDFGLAWHLEAARPDRERRIAGTPPYMSPEQASGAAVTAASDWFSFGVMLYETLTGTLPFTGPTMEVLARSREARVVPPTDFDPSTPADLSALCVDLLQYDPVARPSGNDVLRRVAPLPSADAGAVPAVSPATAAAPFIGREKQLAALMDAFDDSRAGRTTVAFVRGESGMGKSALVQRFLQQVRRSPFEPVVLTGRCYERESVPFKALDSLVDALTFHLKSLPRDDVRFLLPRDVAALARLFPVLREVDAVASAGPMSDSQELRRRAFAAFRELVAALAARRPLVLFIDDLQWGDLDSGALVADLVRPPDSPRLLLVGAYRSEEAETSVFLRTVIPVLRGATAARDVDVAELTPDDALRLALAMTSRTDPASAARARAIAEESGGSPFFIDGLVRYAAEGGGPVASVRLDEVIDARVSQLPAGAKHLLELAAIAGRPLDLSVAAAASTVEGDQQQMLRLLHARRLAKTRGAERPALEIYHDRIRESVAAQIPPETARIYHKRLAEVCEASGRGDPEEVATHYEAAGRADRAAHFAGLAAIRAEDALAFDRAARLYRWVLDLRSRVPVREPAAAASPSEARWLQTQLGNALANAGRGDQAAAAFLAAAEGASADEAAELERRAAEQLLRMGKIDDGLAVLRTVLGRVRLKIACAPATALLSMTGHRVLIGLRGLEFRERPASEIPPIDLRRIDACWTATVGLSMVDTIRGTDFQQRNLLLSLRAGEPYRVARALAMQIPNTSFAGGERGLRRLDRLRRKTMEIVERVGHPHPLGLATVNVGIAYRLHGRYRESLEEVERGGAILRERCTGVAWELQGVRILTMEDLLWLGEWNTLFRRVPEFLQEAESRGDAYGATYIRVRILPLQRLAQDRPEAARDDVRDAIARWSAQGFHLQHYNALFAEVDTDIYEGDGMAGWNRLARSRMELARSMLMYLQAVRIEFLFLRARAALAAVRQGHANMLRSAEADAARLERTRAPWARGMVSLVRAGIASIRGDAAEAVRLAAEAEARLAASDLSHLAAACRRRRGELVGGSEGRALVEEADARLAARQVVNPARMAGLLAPLKV